MQKKLLEQFKDKANRTMGRNVRFTGGCILDKYTVVLSLVEKDIEIHTDYAEVIVLSDKNQTQEYHSYTLDGWVQKIMRFKSHAEQFDGVVILCSSGKVYFLQNGLLSLEVIEDADNWGYLNDINKIGNHLYVCGDRGQIYKRIESNNWIHIDSSVISDKNMHDVLDDVKKSGRKEGQSTVDWIMSLATREIEEKIVFWGINGISANDIYACGSISTPHGTVGVLFHFNGALWSKIDIPETDTLGSIFINTCGEMLVGGLSGHLLSGSSLEGFKDISQPTELMTNNFIVEIEGIVYLGTSSGLFQLEDGRIIPAKINDKISQVDKRLSKNDVLIDDYENYLLLVGIKKVGRYSFKDNSFEIIFPNDKHGK